MTRRRVAMIIALVGLIVWCWPSTYKYGDGRRWHTTRVALGPKVLRFVQRHLAYGRLARAITHGLDNDEARVRAIYAWTVAHINRTIPEGAVIPDDHIWNIIERGYGSDDQIAEVCATLCTYVGVRGAAHRVDDEQGRIRYVTMVALRKSWVPLDPYARVIIENARGELASIEDVMNHPEWVEAATRRAGVDHDGYVWVSEVLRPIEAAPFLRTELQAPWSRLRYEWWRRTGDQRAPGFSPVGDPRA